MDCPNPLTIAHVLYMIAVIFAIGLVLAIIFVGMMFTVYYNVVEKKLKERLDNDNLSD